MIRTSTLKRSGELKRSAPMKQTGFKRKPAMITARPERPPVVLSRPERFKVGQAIIAAAEAVAKTPYVRSKKLREAYRLIPCQNCGREDGTVCCAHSNWAEHGKGKSIKACDTRGASLCSTCHHAIDQGSELTGEERRAAWEAAHVRTLKVLGELGLWPMNIPAPDCGMGQGDRQPALSTADPGGARRTDCTKSQPE